MEIIKNRYGVERSIERIDFKRVRVMGESQFFRTSKDEDRVTMFDFEGGPCLTIGGKIKFEGLDWKIKGIKPRENKYNLGECILDVEPIF